MHNSPQIADNRKQQSFSQGKFGVEPSPTSDKENNRSEVNISQQQFNFKTNQQEALEVLNEVAENSKIDESILDQNLSLFEKITHPKWQVRRLAYIQLSDEFSKNQIVYEFQQAWLKNIINDSNQFAVFEGIKFIEIFVKSQQMNYHILPYFIGDLLEKGAFQKSQCQIMVYDILFQCCKSQQDTAYILNEIDRKIESKHPKIMAFCLGFVDKLLGCDLKVHLNKDQIKNAFQYSISLVQNTNKTIRSQAIDVFTKLYSMVNESFDQIKKMFFNKDMRQIQMRELEQLCSKIQKKTNTIKMDLPQPVIQILDLHQLLPDKFFELPYYKQNERKIKIEQFAKNLEKYDGGIDTNKDYGSIYQIIITILEENNYLIYSVGMRCVKGLVKLMKKAIAQPVAKHFFLLILDKLKGSLSKPLQSSVFNLLEDMLINESISCDLFMELMVNQIELNKNLGQRVACLKWFKDGWLSLAQAIQNKTYDQSDSETLKRFAQANAEKIQKSLIVLYKKVQAISRKENNLNLKKSCQDLLNQLELDENTMTVQVIEQQIAVQQFDFQNINTQESRIQENPVILAPLKLLKQKNQNKSRYQTEEDFCEFAQIQDDMRNKNRKSVELSNNLNREQVEFMQKFSNDLFIIKKLSTQNQEMHVQNKIDEIIQTFKNHYSGTDITGNDFLQQMTANIIEELSIFCKRMQINKKSILDKLNDFVLTLLIKINKIQIALDSQILIEELKISLIRMQFHDKVTPLLESLYICCSLENMTKASIRILNKYVNSANLSNYKPFQQFFNWLNQKIHQAPSQQLEAQFIRASFKSFEGIQKLLLACQSQLDLRPILQNLQSRMTQQQSTSVDQLADAYNEFINHSNRKSKSIGSGSRSRFSPYETPNKTKSRLEFTSSDEKDNHDSLQQIEQQLLNQFSVQAMENLITYLNRQRAHQLSNQSQHTVFLSPNSHSPGKHWRRGMGRDNMIISTPGRLHFNGQKFDEYSAMLEVIGLNYQETYQTQVFQIYYILKHTFPAGLPNLINMAFYYISTQPHKNQDNYNTFMSNILQIDKNIISYQYRLAFNQLYSQNDSDSQHLLINLIQNGFMFIYYNIMDQNILPNFPYYVTTLTYMLQLNQYKELSSNILEKANEVNSQINQFIETELIKYKKLYDIYIIHTTTKQEEIQEPITPQLASFGQFDLKKLYHDNQNTIQHSNQILVMDLQNIEECATKREETVRDQEKDNFHPNQIHFNKEDFELLESTTKNFNSQQTLRFTEDFCQSGQQQNNFDLLNIQQFISPLQQYSQVSAMQDTVIQEITKNLYQNHDHQQNTLHELNQIKQINESYRQHKRDSSKIKEDGQQATVQSQELNIQQHQFMQQYQQQYEQYLKQQQQQPQQITKQQERQTFGQTKQQSQTGDNFYKQPTIEQNKQMCQTQDSFKQKTNQFEKIFQDVQNESQINKNSKSLLSDLLAPIENTSLFDATRNTKRNECIKHMQEVLLTSTSLYFDVANTLLQQYESLDMLDDKVTFVNDLKLSLINQTLLTNINDQNFSVIISIVLRLCTSASTQNEIYNTSLGYDDNSLTKSLQLILDVLLHSKQVDIVVISLIRVLNDHLPMDFTNEINRNEKMMLRLNLKCIERLLDNVEDIHIFSILIEVLKFFKFHPPENLIEGLPSIKELELYFRQMKQITDKLILINKKQAKDFLEFIYRDNNKSIFLEYLKNALQ